MKVLRPDDIHPSSARLWLWVGRRSCDRWRALQGGHRVAPQDLDDNTGDAETGAECKDIMVYYVGRVYQTQNILCRESVSECIGIGECDGATAGRWLWPYASLSRGAACALDLWLASGLTSSISSKRGEKYVDVLLCIDLEKDARIGIKNPYWELCPLSTERFWTERYGPKFAPLHNTPTSHFEQTEPLMPSKCGHLSWDYGRHRDRG